jgi:ADP-ribosylglycohydrolase
MDTELDIRRLLRAEVDVLAEQGYVPGKRGEQAIAAIDEGRPLHELSALLDDLVASPLERMPDWPYFEPSDWPSIEQTLSNGGSPIPHSALRIPHSAQALFDRIYGGWLGRCAGCMLGKPVEGWRREEIRRYLQVSGAYPLSSYFPDPPPSWSGSQVSSLETLKSRLQGVARDDDIDYTLLALALVERHGRSFKTADVASGWLASLPFLQVYTAERVAYRNLVNAVPAEEVADLRNPYREYIGAQIRADLYGYISPGDPAMAAALAHKDANLSHRANGLYGAMWVAAMVAAACSRPTMEALIAAGLEQIPPRSRLAEAIRLCLRLRRDGTSWEEARDEIERKLGRYNWIHTINNAAVVALALLWGETDFGASICLAVMGGWDTDCNGATTGSILGVWHGAEALPREWTAPLGDAIRSAVSGFDGTSIREAARRTLNIASATK